MRESPLLFLKKFVTDAWYKVFIVLGVVLFAVSLIFELKGITNIAQLFAGGFFFLGIGEWINHKDLPAVFELGTFTLFITKTSWKPKILGLVFDILGIFLFFIGINLILNYL